MVPMRVARLRVPFMVGILVAFSGYAIRPLLLAPRLVRVRVPVAAADTERQLQRQDRRGHQCKQV